MKLLKILFSKPTLIVFSIFLQIAFFMSFFYMVQLSFQWVQAITYVLTIVVFLAIVNKDSKPDHKLPWLTLILLVPFFGLIMFLLFGNVRISKKHRKIFKELQAQEQFLKDEREEERIRVKLGEHYGQSLSIKKQGGYNAYTNTSTKYFSTGEDFYQSLLEDLKQAKKFIFMEYFIIERGFMWDGILEILKEKVSSGVDVRILYDDFGCLWKLKNNYYKTLRKLGIKCYKFNKFNPTVSNVHNYRDHRKITVIDGRVAYTGGANIADEYINVVQKFGYWKDTAIRISGEAVKNFTLMFLQNYYLMANIKTERYEKFVSESFAELEDGVVQPFASDTIRRVGESVLLNIINQAKNYVYITTPYLICDFTLLSAIKEAAVRGVDVRIVVPNIPDKKIVWMQTRSNFYGLIKEGVKIYQYDPGFIHSKVILCDDLVGIVGTINLDYRSLVHHFEDGVYMYNTSCLKDVAKDFEDSFRVSTLQTLETAKLGFFNRLFCAFIKIFSPMM